MNQKKIGVLILVLAAVLVGIFLFVIQSLNQQIQTLGCFADPSCTQVETSLSIVHFAFGIFGFLFSLGFYLLVFATGEEAIVKRLESDTTRKLSEEKFSILLKGLDEYEKKVLSAVREQNGITQQTLRLRTNFSKAKLSQVLTTLEKKELVRREKEKKTLAVYLTE